MCTFIFWTGAHVGRGERPVLDAIKLTIIPIHHFNAEPSHVQQFMLAVVVVFGSQAPEVQR